MRQYTVTFQPSNLTLQIEAGTTLLQAQITAGLHPDAPCGGMGACGKCRVHCEGQEVLACQTVIDRDMTVTLPHRSDSQILTAGRTVRFQPDGEHRYCLAFDIGTTTVVAYLLDGQTGALISTASTVNPQSQYGADVISRIQYALEQDPDVLETCIKSTMGQLTQEVSKKAGILPAEITIASIAGNTAMHHLLLGIDPRPLVTPPYMPQVFQALELPAEDVLPIRGTVRVLPNIAGFVGGDTIGCMAATRFDKLEELTLMIDIGTNGEMVLGDKHRRIACSTAAGPAFEGAKISCGMRGAEGAVDHVSLANGTMAYHVIGEGNAKGLCGSGLLDLIALLLEQEIIDESGYLEDSSYQLCDAVTLTQKDIREVQLAKAAIRAGIELMVQKIGAAVTDIRRVYLAGAFGNYLDPASACRIGMIPPCLENRIHPIGNAAGEGARLCALSLSEFQYAQALAKNTEFLELATMPEFQDRFVDALEF